MKDTRGETRISPAQFLAVERHRQPLGLRYRRFIERHPMLPIGFALALVIICFALFVKAMKLWGVWA